MLVFVELIYLMISGELPDSYGVALFVSNKIFAFVYSKLSEQHMCMFELKSSVTDDDTVTLAARFEEVSLYPEVDTELVQIKNFGRSFCVYL